MNLLLNVRNVPNRDVLGVPNSQVTNIKSWGNLHWLCTACEVEARHLCNITDSKLSTERQTVKILAEYEKRNILIHNHPEITKDNLQERNKDDTKRIDELMEQGTSVSCVKVIKLIRLGGRGQNQQSTSGYTFQMH